MSAGIVSIKQVLESKKEYYLKRVEKENHDLLDGHIAKRVGAFIAGYFDESMASANLYTHGVTLLDEASQKLQVQPSDKNSAIEKLQKVKTIFDDAAKNPKYFVGNSFNVLKIQERKAEFKSYSDSLSQVIKALG